jgi:hypothetical protein
MEQHEATKFSTEVIEQAAHALGEGNVFRVEVNGFGGTRRLVVAPFYDTQEVMVAVEGGGCVFMEANMRHNRFIFIQHGFQMPHAEAAEQLLNGIADLATKNKALSDMMSDQSVRPQITDQSKPAKTKKSPNSKSSSTE